MKHRDFPRFFVRDLGANGPLPALEHLVPEARDAAAMFVHHRLLDAYVVRRMQRAFAGNGDPRHVFIEHALRIETADSIAKNLLTATFARHHYTPYPIHIAALSSIHPQTALGRFVSWLLSPAAAAYHTILVGAQPLPKSVSSAWVQVQVARMTTGEYFPMHIDTEDEGITCVYQFTSGYSDEDGGRLYLGPSEHGADIVIAPVFGSLCIFRPKNAPHGVTTVNAPADRPRFTVSAFYLYGKHRAEERELARSL